MLILCIVATLVSAVVVWRLHSAAKPSLDDPAIKSKFQLYFWEKVKALEANGTTRLLTVDLTIDCSAYEDNRTAAYNFRTEVADFLAQKHNATILYIGKALSFIDIKISVPEIKNIAAYEFIEHLGDCEGGAWVTPDFDTASVLLFERGWVG
jgi:hypothetical protein